MAQSHAPARDRFPRDATGRIGLLVAHTRYRVSAPCKPHNPHDNCSCRNREGEGWPAAEPAFWVNRMSVEQNTEWSEEKTRHGILPKGYP